MTFSLFFRARSKRQEYFHNTERIIKIAVCNCEKLIGYLRMIINMIDSATRSYTSKVVTVLLYKKYKLASPRAVFITKKILVALGV